MAIKMTNENATQSRGRNKIATRFRTINISLFIIVSVVIAVAMYIVLEDITDRVSKDYAALYSSDTVGTLNTYFGRDIALLRTAANSMAVINWFADEHNQEYKQTAYNEMIGIIDVLQSDNLYIGIEKTYSEMSVGKGDAIDDIQPFAVLDPDYYDDAWYFACTSSERDYQLNVDIDKIYNRKLVWLNYKVARDGEVFGVICTGLEFSHMVESLFADYDVNKVRVMIIDEFGSVQMDNALMGSDSFLHYSYGDEYYLHDEINDPAFLLAAESYLAGIDGYFTKDHAASPVIEMSSGGYRYATIAPITDTTWSVVTLYDSSTLFNMSVLYPLFAIILVLFVVFIVITSVVSHHSIFLPFNKLMSSIRAIDENKNERVFGADRRDEFGDLSHTIQQMKDRLDSYNLDLEEEVAARSADLRLAYETIMDGIDYASKIQKNLLPNNNLPETVFSDYSAIWKPRDVVGGDIYWVKQFDKGTVLCVADCTGHGTPGALLTMLVVSAFESFIRNDNCMDTAGIMWNLEQRLLSVFNVDSDTQDEWDIKDGCDLAILFIAKDGSVTLSAGNTHVFVCDGVSVNQIKGQKIFIGEGRITKKEDIEVITIPAHPDNQFYIASDGLFDQCGVKNERPYGYREFKEIILKNHAEKQSVITEKVWEAFESYRGTHNMLDDVELIAFKP